ncbi:hypothetical protein AM588_10007601 [Phytophthora nicotianae]|uniref:Uncharacterized protein n=1 Tax=Phytophthora nicotianae TaxID=4792 RepID=A0A0W8DCQ7_PHYNI|nr:hypothetical protein AM588_10007601 [Phytophthora nicotianae]
MHLMYYLGDDGKRVYTLKFSKERITTKKRFACCHAVARPDLPVRVAVDDRL